MLLLRESLIKMCIKSSIGSIWRILRSLRRSSEIRRSRIGMKILRKSITIRKIRRNMVIMVVVGIRRRRCSCLISGERKQNNFIDYDLLYFKRGLF